MSEIGGGGGGGSSGLLLPNGANAPAWHQALMTVMSGAGDATILGIGDSILSGLFGTNIGPGPMIQVVKMLGAALGIPVSDGLAIPPAGALAGPDNRFTLGAGWTYGTNGFFPGNCWGGVVNTQCCFFAPNATATNLTFQPRAGLQNVDTFDVYTIGGNFSVNFNGGADTVVGALAGVQKTTVSGASTSRPTCNVHAITSGVGGFVIGFDARLSTVPTLRVGNASVTSASTGGTASVAGWTNTSGVAASQPMVCVSAYNPNVGLVNLSVNDLAQGLTIPQSIANWTTIANTLKACQGGKGGVIFVSENPVSPGTDATAAQTAYWNALKSFCATNGYPLIDIFSGLNGSGNGFSVLSNMTPDWYGDGNSIHPGNAGQTDYGRMIASGLLQL